MNFVQRHAKEEAVLLETLSFEYVFDLWMHASYFALGQSKSSNPSRFSSDRSEGESGPSHFLLPVPCGTKDRSDTHPVLAAFQRFEAVRLSFSRQRRGR